MSINELVSQAVWRQITSRVTPKKTAGLPVYVKSKFRVIVIPRKRTSAIHTIGRRIGMRVSSSKAKKNDEAIGILNLAVVSWWVSYCRSIQFQFLCSMSDPELVDGSLSKPAESYIRYRIKH